MHVSSTRRMGCARQAEGTHQDPAHPRPRPVALGRPDLRVARHRKAGPARDRQAAERQHRPVPAAQRNRRLDHTHRARHPEKPEIHRSHGVRAPPHLQRPQDPRTSRPVAMVTGPTHPAIVDRETWQDAQGIGALHGTSRDDDPAAPPDGARFYPYLARVLCRDCRHRMAGTPPKGSTGQYIYYRCPYNSDDSRYPDHPRTVQTPDPPRRHHGPVLPRPHIRTPARRPARHPAPRNRRRSPSPPRRRHHRPHHPHPPARHRPDHCPGRNPRRPRRRHSRLHPRPFTELHDQRQHAETQLAALAAATPKAADPALLDELPHLGDILPGLPDQLKARLFAAFDLTVLWNKPGQLATVTIEITDAALQALPAILNPSQDGYHDTANNTPAGPTPMGQLIEPARSCQSRN